MQNPTYKVIGKRISTIPKHLKFNKTTIFKENHVPVEQFTAFAFETLIYVKC